MNILCLNTAFSEAHIALKFGDKTYFERVDANSKHSENLLSSIELIFEKIIKDNKLKLNSNEILKNLDVISVVVGPGSFTGLRISIATAKALLITNPKIKIIAVNSLELIANQYAQNNKIIKNIFPLIDALSGLYYIAEFDKNLNCITHPQMIDENQLKTYKNFVSNDNSLSDNFVNLTPEILLDLTQKKIALKEFILEKELSPLYLRPSQAEAELTCKQKLKN
jgi:tRNA threonylcarbamoyl adenosine modification protein YeaZ